MSEAQAQLQGFALSENPADDEQAVVDAVLTLIRVAHGRAVAAGWWTDLDTGKPKNRNVGELLMLTVSEIAEAMEGHRKNLMDDHLPQYAMFDVELADALIRIADLAGSYAPWTAAATGAKLAYNRNRADHKIENRQKADGKKY